MVKFCSQKCHENIIGRANWRSNYCSRHNIFRQLIWYFFSSDLDETFKYCCLHYFNKVLMTKYEILSYHAFEFYLRGFLCFWNHQSKTFPKLCVTSISLDWKLEDGLILKYYCGANFRNQQIPPLRAWKMFIFKHKTLKRSAILGVHLKSSWWSIFRSSDDREIRPVEI